MKRLAASLLVAFLVAAGVALAQQPSAITQQKTTIFGVTLGEPMPSGPDCTSASAGQPCSRSVPQFGLDARQRTFTYWKRVWTLRMGELLEVTEIDGRVEGISTAFGHKGTTIAGGLSGLYDSVDQCTRAQEALVDKFGKPPVKVNNLTNGYGAPVQQLELDWALPDAVMIFLDPSGDLNSCRFQIASFKLLKRDAEEREKNKAKF